MSNIFEIFLNILYYHELIIDYDKGYLIKIRTTDITWNVIDRFKEIKIIL